MLNNIFGDISKICGLDVPAQSGFGTDKLVDEYIRETTKGAISLANYLGYRYFDEVLDIFYHENNYAGFMLEISPIVGSNDDIEKNLNLFFNNELPENSYIQFLLIASHDIDEQLKIWKQSRGRWHNESLRKLGMYREAFLREKAKDFANADGRMGRDFRIYVCYSTDLRSSSKRVEGIHKFQRKLVQKLNTLKLFPRICRAEDLIKVAGDLAQMQMTSKGRVKYDPCNLLSKQILKPLSRTTVEEELIIHQDEGLVSKCFYPRTLPEEFSLMEMIGLLGSEREGISIPARFVISYSLASDISKAGQSKIINKGHRAIHAAEQWYTRHDTNLRKEALEWREVIARHKNGEQFLSESMQVMITSSKEEIEIAQENLKSLYNSLDWQLEINRNLQLPAMLSILPMQQARYWHVLKAFQLVKTMQSREVVAKIPIHGEWMGVPESGVLLLGRRGQMFNWTPFYRVGGGGNYNVCVMAPSGSGKSVFLQELAVSMMVQGKSVFILDIGASYQNICELTDGEVVRFSNNNNLSLNPFAALAGSGAVYIRARDLHKLGQTIEQIAYHTGLSFEEIQGYLAMVGGTGSGQDNQSESADDIIEILEVGKHFVTKDSIIYAKSIAAAMCGIKGDAHNEAIIERAITQGIEKYGTQLDITKLAFVLKGLEGIEAVKLAQTLYPYTEKGIHGRFFKAGKAASFTEMMTIFEFEEIKNDEVLLSVVLQVILMQVTMQFLCGDRSKQFVLIVDEAWKILDFCGAFLEAFARTVRKYGGSLITCVQDLSSFVAGKSQKAILENSSWKAILKQDNLKSFQEYDTFKDHLALIESITKEASGKYSEVMLKASGLAVVGRLVLDPYSVALFSTEASDFNLLARLRQQGLSKDEAIKELAKKYGKLPDMNYLLENTNEGKEERR